MAKISTGLVVKRLLGMIRPAMLRSVVFMRAHSSAISVAFLLLVFKIILLPLFQHTIVFASVTTTFIEGKSTLLLRLKVGDRVKSRSDPSCCTERPVTQFHHVVAVCSIVMGTNYFSVLNCCFRYFASGRTRSVNSSTEKEEKEFAERECNIQVARDMQSSLMHRLHHVVTRRAFCADLDHGQIANLGFIL